MKIKSMLKLLHLEKKAFENIKKAVQKEEQYTDGEIVLALASESTSYAFWELLASIIVSVFVFIACLPFSKNFELLAYRLFWDIPVWFLPFCFGSIIFITILLVFFVTNIPFIDRLIIPSTVQKHSVYEKALRCFTEKGVYKTKHSSGILIFASYLERKVYILADTGIAEKIEQSVWDSIANELASDLGKGNGEKAFIHAVESCGTLLRKNFPAKNENPDELPDGLEIL